MPTRAIATFEITAWDETTYAESADSPKLSRATVRKTFQGDLTGESTAELLMSQAANGAAGYVALERVVGRVGERAGSFDVQHCATQGGAEPQAFWFVVPGSGTGELCGLRGTVAYHHDEHGATFTLDYAFDEQDYSCRSAEWRRAAEREHHDLIARHELL